MSAREQFDDVVSAAHAALRGDEVLLSDFHGEDSEFIRFNGDAVRQAGSVTQREVGLDLIDGLRHATGSVSLTGDPAEDRRRVVELVGDLRQHAAVAPEDPYLLHATDVAPVDNVQTADLPVGADTVSRVLDASAGHDLVGIWAAGESHVGMASSAGVRHWHTAASFNLDWSFYVHHDKAAKNLHAGSVWDDGAFEAKVAQSASQVEALGRPALTRPPGGYRAYLAPAALHELMEWYGYGGFGLRAHETRQTPFLRMVTEGATLHPGVTITEDTAGGTAPSFQRQGFVRPERVALIEGGAYVGHLVSPRSAVEFDAVTNGASGAEQPESLAVAPGDVPTERVLDELGTGLYVGNLWYLNWSDRSACRTTGMTRFATFWVEDGEIVAPVDVLRFDDTAFHLLGDRLVGLTDTAETVLDPSSYGGRSLVSRRVPGALVEEMAFTL